MVPGWRDLLAWLCGWKSSGIVVRPPAGQVVTPGVRAGQVDLPTAAVAQVDTPGQTTGQIYG